MKLGVINSEMENGSTHLLMVVLDWKKALEI